MSEFILSLFDFFMLDHRKNLITSQIYLRLALSSPSWSALR